MHLLKRHITRFLLSFWRHRLLFWRFQTAVLFGNISRSIRLRSFLHFLSFLAVILLQTADIYHRRDICISISNYYLLLSLLIRMLFILWRLLIYFFFFKLFKVARIGIIQFFSINYITLIFTPKILTSLR